MRLPTMVGPAYFLVLDGNAGREIHLDEWARFTDQYLASWSHHRVFPPVLTDLYPDGELHRVRRVWAFGVRSQSPDIDFPWRLFPTYGRALAACQQEANELAASDPPPF